MQADRSSGKISSNTFQGRERAAKIWGRLATASIAVSGLGLLFIWLLVCLGFGQMTLGGWLLTLFVCLPLYFILATGSTRFSNPGRKSTDQLAIAAPAKTGHALRVISLLLLVLVLLVVYLAIRFGLDPLINLSLSNQFR